MRVGTAVTRKKVTTVHKAVTANGIIQLPGMGWENIAKRMLGIAYLCNGKQDDDAGVT